MRFTGQWRRERDSKTRSTRILTLGPSTLAFLEMHRESQRQVAPLFGKDYRANLDLIFASPECDYIHPQAVSNTMSRHTSLSASTGWGFSRCATPTPRYCSARGPVDVVSKQLGDAALPPLRIVYAHALPSEELAAAAKWEEIRWKKAAETEAAAAGPPFASEERPGTSNQNPATKRLQ